MADDGMINQLFLIPGFNNYGEFGKSENFSGRYKFN